MVADCRRQQTVSRQQPDFVPPAVDLRSWCRWATIAVLGNQSPLTGARKRNSGKAIAYAPFT